MQRRSLWSVDDILGRKREDRDCYHLTPRHQSGTNSCNEKSHYNQTRQVRNKDQAHAANAQTKCSRNRPTFVPCQSTCCHTPHHSQERGSAYKMNPMWQRYYVSYGMYASQLYLRNHLYKPLKKRMRASFSHEQVLALQKVFSTKKYLDNAERNELARKLNMTDQQIKIWFQNRRYKEKKLQKNEERRDGALCDSMLAPDSYETINSHIMDDFKFFSDSDSDVCLEIVE
eukprot:Seg2623.1 transcript_id=Seg2623.1/GoldUCD/mRNA.D3Y31 product="Homeobox protein koza" protein_id=Seg2623.1/GoldUCD/D3Y31